MSHGKASRLQDSGNYQAAAAAEAAAGGKSKQHAKGIKLWKAKMIEADEYTYEYIETDIETDIDDMKRKLGTDIDDMKRKLEDDIVDAQFSLSKLLIAKIIEAPDQSKSRNSLLAIGAKCAEITGQGLSSRYE